MTPLGWRYITGIEFTDRWVELDKRISHTEVAGLLEIYDVEESRAEDRSSDG